MDIKIKGYDECPTLQSDIEAFLATGGQITQCPPLTFTIPAGRQNIREQNEAAWRRSQVKKEEDRQARHVSD